MVRCGTVEGRGDDLTLDRAFHVGHLFGTLVHENDHEVHLGVVDRDRVRDLLHDDRLARLRRGHDQPTLPLTDGRDDVDDPRGELVGLGRFEAQALLWVQRRELGELGAIVGRLGCLTVDGVETHKSVELAARAVARWDGIALAVLANGSGDRVAATKTVLTHLTERDVDVARPGQVARRAHERVVVVQVEDPGDGEQDVVVSHLNLLVQVRSARGAGTAALGAVALALAVAVAAPATAASALIVAVFGLRAGSRGGCRARRGVRASRFTPTRIASALGPGVLACALRPCRILTARLGAIAFAPGDLGA